VVTFDPHPLQLLRPDDPPELLTPASVKEDLIATLGVDQLFVIPFTEEFSQVSAEDFCRDVLAGQLQARYVSVGENFRFGHRARGDAELLRGRREFEAAIVPLVHHQGDAISSTRIRGLLRDGDVSAASELLGAPFQLEGVVSRGSGRGRKLGMPTANIALPDHVVVPRPGIYAGLTLGHAAAVSIGVRPTFERDGELLVEAYIVDFEGDLYGRTLRLAFLERLRDEERFESADGLVAQMRHDVERVRQVYAASRES
jgi:riboflavin kinase/FMN adenylyltransferase